MSYQDVVEIHESPTIRARMMACVALEGIPEPESWAYQNAWKLAAMPGWSTAWAQARTDGMDEAERGRSDDVITDDMLLQAVRSLTAQEAP